MASSSLARNPTHPTRSDSPRLTPSSSTQFQRLGASAWRRFESEPICATAVQGGPQILTTAHPSSDTLLPIGEPGPQPAAQGIHPGTAPTNCPLVMAFDGACRCAFRDQTPYKCWRKLPVRGDCRALLVPPVHHFATPSSHKANCASNSPTFLGSTSNRRVNDHA